jgi:hypothetical protein
VKGHGAKFGRKKEQAIAALLTHRTTEEAALAVGIGISTLWRWMKEREFKAAYLQARREAVSQAVARIQQATGAAGVTILKLMTDPSVPAAVRLRAAECVFGMAVKGIETEDIEARVAELERERAAEASNSTQKK